MLWKKPRTSKRETRHVALKRLEHLTRRFRRNPELYRLYSQGIQNYIQQGYTGKLTENEAISPISPTTWYLPHHLVQNVNKPGKVRIVFDAAAKVEGLSLNDMLDTGPDLTNNLAGILIRFRNYPVAVVADIEAMFHQVYVTDKDRDSLRFRRRILINHP